MPNAQKKMQGKIQISTKDSIGGQEITIGGNHNQCTGASEVSRLYISKGLIILVEIIQHYIIPAKRTWFYIPYSV